MARPLASTVVVGLLVAGLGCSESTSPVDDADGASPEEDAEQGRRDVERADVGEGSVEIRPGPLTLVAESIEATTERLCDLDEDGVPDNSIADLGEPASGVYVMMLSSTLEAGVAAGTRLLAHFPWLDDISAPDDPDATVLFIDGNDVDAPDDSSDDFAGDEAFYGSAKEFEPCGAPRHPARGATLAAGTLAAGPLSIAVTVDNDPLDIDHARVSGSIAPFGSAAELEVCGYVTILSLGELPGFSGAGLTMLEEFLAGGAVVGVPGIPGLSPDVDLDGDGLERFDVDVDGRIQTCIDGDSTAIPGSDCWADSRFADGFSLSFRMHSVGARFAGREPGWESSFYVEELCDRASPDDELLQSPAHDEAECALVDEPCDPLRRGGSCCDPSHVCTGERQGVLRCAAPCDPSPCTWGSHPSVCRPATGLGPEEGYCFPISSFFSGADCTPGTRDCGSGETYCARVDAGGWTACCSICTREPSGCDEETHVCLTQVFGPAGACVLRDPFDGR